MLKKRCKTSGTFCCGPCVKSALYYVVTKLGSLCIFESATRSNIEELCSKWHLLTSWKTFLWYKVAWFFKSNLDIKYVIPKRNNVIFFLLLLLRIKLFFLSTNVTMSIFLAKYTKVLSYYFCYFFICISISEVLYLDCCGKVVLVYSEINLHFEGSFVA